MQTKLVPQVPPLDAKCKMWKKKENKELKTRKDEAEKQPTN